MSDAEIIVYQAKKIAQLEDNLKNTTEAMNYWFNECHKTDISEEKKA